MRRRGLFIAAVAMATAALTPALAPAQRSNEAGGTPPTITPIAEGLAGPLQFAVGEHQTLYVGQSFAGLLTRIRGADRADIASVPGGDISGVSLASDDDDDVYYTVTATAPDKSPIANLSVVRDGSSSVVADLQAYEATNNPDQSSTYGFVGISPDCAAQVPPDAGPATYTGTIDSHPYASAATKRRGVYVADAAGNDIVQVSPEGEVHTVSVLPPQPLVITADLAAKINLPACAVGLTYNFEPVPTDVEIGRDGWLYVTTLPGGPEDPSFPPRGGVWKINPLTGEATQLVGGLAGATNLAIGRHGTIYVTELFGGRVSRIRHGQVTPLIDLPSPASIEYADGKLYVGYDVFSDSGKIGVISR